MIKKYLDLIIAGVVIIALLVLSGVRNSKHNSPVREVKEINSPLTTEVQEENNTNNDNNYEYSNDIPKNDDVFYKGVNAKVERRIQDLGFTRDDNCIAKDYCYTLDKYKASYSTNSVWFELSINVPDENIKKYDPKKDFEMLEKIYGIKIDNVSNMKKLINNFSNKTFESFTIDTNGLYLHVSHYVDDLEYSVSDSIYNEYSEYYKPTSLSTILNGKNDFNSKIMFYDIAIENNVKYFKYYDYAYNRLKKDGENICEIVFENENYKFETSYCHGGTSNTSYNFTYRVGSNKEETVTSNIKGSYFDEYYDTILKTDIDYFSKKLDEKIKISDENLKLVKELVQNEGNDLHFKVENVLEVEINRESYSSVYYDVKYIIFKN